MNACLLDPTKKNLLVNSSLRSKDPNQSKISTAALLMITAVGACMAALAWKGKIVLAAVHLSFPVSVVIVSTITIFASCIWLVRRDFSARKEEKSYVSTSSNSLNIGEEKIRKKKEDLQPNSTHSTSMSLSPSRSPTLPIFKSTPLLLKKENYSPDLLSNSHIASTKSSLLFSENISSKSQTSQPFAANVQSALNSFARQTPASPSIGDMKATAAKLEKNGNIYGACKQYFKLINALSKEKKLSEISNLDCLLSKLISPLKEIDCLSDLREHLEIFSKVYQLTSVPNKEAILRSCSNIVILADRIEAYLNSSKSARTNWQKTLTYLGSLQNKVKDLNACFPKKEFLDKFCGIYRNAFHEFWKPFSKRLSCSSHQEVSAKYLCEFVQFLDKYECFQSEAKKFFEKKIKELSKDLKKEFFLAVKLAVETQHLNYSEKNTLNYCFSLPVIKKPSKILFWSGNRVFDLTLRDFLEKLKTSKEEKVFRKSFAELIVNIVNTKIIKKEDQLCFKNQWEKCILLTRTSEFLKILNSEVIPEAVRILKMTGDDFLASCLVKAMEISPEIRDKRILPWMEKMYEQARTSLGLSKEKLEAVLRFHRL